MDWVIYARAVRSTTLVVRESDYVAAAKSGGLPTRRILWRHVLPNTVTQSVVYLTSDIVLVIVAVVTLGYLGLGVQPPTPDWGTMISEGQEFLTTSWGWPPSRASLWSSPAWPVPARRWAGRRAAAAMSDLRVSRGLLRGHRD